MMPLGSVLGCGTWFSLIEEQLYCIETNILHSTLERGRFRAIAGMPGLEEGIESFKLRIAPLFDILPPFTGIDSPRPHEGLADEVRPGFEAPQGFNSLGRTPRLKIGFHNG